MPKSMNTGGPQPRSGRKPVNDARKVLTDAPNNTHPPPRTMRADRITAIAALAARGLRTRHIAEIAKIDESQVSRILRRPETQAAMQAHIDRMLAAPVAIFGPMLPAATRAYADGLAEAQDIGTRVGVAQHVFEWAIGKPIVRSTHDAHATVQILVLDGRNAHVMEGHAPVGGQIDIMGIKSNRYCQVDGTDSVGGGLGGGSVPCGAASDGAGVPLPPEIERPASADGVLALLEHEYVEEDISDEP